MAPPFLPSLTLQPQAAATIFIAAMMPPPPRGSARLRLPGVIAELAPTRLPRLLLIACEFAITPAPPEPLALFLLLPSPSLPPTPPYHHTPAFQLPVVVMPVADGAAAMARSVVC